MKYSLKLNMHKTLLGQSKKGNFFWLGNYIHHLCYFAFYLTKKMLKDFSDFSKIFTNLYYPNNIITKEMAPFAGWI